MNPILQDVKRTQVEMMRDRGYVISEESNEPKLIDPDLPWDTFAAYYKELAASAPGPRTGTGLEPSLTETYLHSDNMRIALVYYSSSTPGKDHVPKSEVTLFHERVRRGIQIGGQYYAYNLGIFITDQPLGNESRDLIAKSITAVMQHFRYRDLIVNPTKHVLNVPHTLVPEEFKLEVLRDYNVITAEEKLPLDPEQRRRKIKEDLEKVPRILPRLLSSNPMCRYYDWKVGSLIRVDRDTKGLGLIASKSIMYRYVVNG